MLNAYGSKTITRLWEIEGGKESNSKGEKQQKYEAGEKWKHDYKLKKQKVRKNKEGKERQKKDSHTTTRFQQV